MTISSIVDLIKRELESGGLSNLREVVKGTPEEQAAIDSILANLRETALAVENGSATPSDLKFAVAEATGGLQALADAKVLRVEKAAIRIAMKIITELIPPFVVVAAVPSHAPTTDA